MGYTHLYTESINLHRETSSRDNRTSSHPGLVRHDYTFKYHPTSDELYTDETYVVKGSGSSADENISIRLQDVRDRLHRMHNISSTPIKDLKGTDEEDFRMLVHYTQLLYGTSSYSAYYDEIQKVFGTSTDGINNSKCLKPGTVGAYFAGCMMKTSFTDQNNPSMNGCSVLCAGSIPQPTPDPGKNLCQYSVLWATDEEGSYKFTVLHETSNHEEVIVYVDNNASPYDKTSFTGWTDSEKDALREFGAKQVNIIQYGEDAKTYQEVYGGFVELDKIPSRVETIANFQATNSNTVFLVVLVLLIVVAVFVGYKIVN